MTRRKGSRVYWRNQGGARRAYGDFREFKDVGGGREALVSKGEGRATRDPDVAQRVASQRVSELERLRRNKGLLGISGQATLATFAAHHLDAKAKAGKTVRTHLEDVERRLTVSLDYLGSDRAIDTVGVRDIESLAVWLAGRPNGRGGKFSSGTVRHYLNALSNLFRRAAGEAIVPPGYNPVAAMLEKPTARRQEARWLEAHDAALLLESARIWKPARPDTVTPGLYAIVATFLLTGGRKSEVLGLEGDDISFDRKTVTFRPNQWRRLKTSTSRRVVRLWPQLEEILRRHVFERDEPLGALLFPARVERVGREQMVGDLDKALDAIAVRGGWQSGDIRSKAFRHTYCAARLQTLDRGFPVGEYTVGKELGHGGFSLVRRVYGHLGQVRHRAEVVEFRVEQHADALGERLMVLRAASAVTK